MTGRREVPWGIDESVHEPNNAVVYAAFKTERGRMSVKKTGYGALFMAFLAIGCGGGAGTTDSGPEEWTLDMRSWNQGTFSVMAEMVDYGVKKLALGAALPPNEMDLVVDDAIEIAARHNVEVFREDDFLVTDLFSPEITEGKHVLFFCHESTYQDYQALKVEKRRLEALGEYEGEARTEIARRFGKLLSYPEATIERELAH